MIETERRWLDFAEEDLKVAKLALSENIPNQSCFHSQQCVEKVLKYLIEKSGKVAPKTHKLADLFSLIAEKRLADLQNEILLLDRFYIPTRYPNALPGTLPDGLPSIRDAKEAVATAETIFDRVEKM